MGKSVTACHTTYVPLPFCFKWRVSGSKLYLCCSATAPPHSLILSQGHGRIPADPAWGTAYTFLADWVGKYYHDNQIFQEHCE